MFYSSSPLRRTWAPAHIRHSKPYRDVGGRCEEAELAAGVGMRRAATAEAEAEQLRLSLMEAQKQAKDLGWQVRSFATV